MSTGLPGDSPDLPSQPARGFAAVGGLDLRSLSPPQWLVIGGAIVYFLAMLFPWISISLQGLPGVGESANGLGQGTLLLAWLLLVAAAAWLLLPLFGVHLQIPAPRTVVTLGLTGLALLLTVVKIIDVATSGGGFEGIDVSPGFGAYLGLLAALAAVAGAVLLFLADSAASPVTPAA